MGTKNARLRIASNRAGSHAIRPSNGSGRRASGSPTDFRRTGDVDQTLCPSRGLRDRAGDHEAGVGDFHGIGVDLQVASGGAKDVTQSDPQTDGAQPIACRDSPSVEPLDEPDHARWGRALTRFRVRRPSAFRPISTPTNRVANPQAGGAHPKPTPPRRAARSAGCRGPSGRHVTGISATVGQGVGPGSHDVGSPMPADRTVQARSPAFRER